MPVPANIDALSTTAASNSPSGSETPTEGDNYIRTLSAFIASLRDKLNGTSATGTVKDATFSGTHTFSSGNLLPGTYTPTLTNVSNVSSSSAHVCMYRRIGDIVSVWGVVDVSATSGADVATVLQISLPIASNLAAYANLTGTGTCLGAAPIACAVRTPSDFSDVAEVYYKSDTTAATYLHFQFSYRVI